MEDAKKKNISIHAPTRGATQEHNKDKSHREFQSTLPQGERQKNRDFSRRSKEYFNPRSHKGSDYACRCLDPGRFVISIHAPTRGATHKNRETEVGYFISIHAPTRGATVAQSYEYISQDDFNPRSHKGSDSNFTQNSISVLFHFYQSFPHIIFPHTARFRLLIIFCTFFLVRIAQRFPVCFHFAPKQYPAFYNVCSTDLL